MTVFGGTKIARNGEYLAELCEVQNSVADDIMLTVY